MSSVVDPRVREQQRHLQVPQLVQPVNIVGLQLVSRDNQDVVGQLALVQLFEHNVGVWADLRQERLGRPVEHLNRRDMRLEIAVVDQLVHGLRVKHQRLN
jgi:hypothetical protein